MSRKITITTAVILTIGVAWAVNWQSTTAQEPALTAEATNESVEVLARGPVHEAFAEPVNLQGYDPLVIEVAPPEPVEELPPEQRLEGDNVEWIPGYWAWDDEREGFIWVSGVWRECPPGQQWVPGYWSEGDGSWYWTAGFWVSEEAEELQYLPEPPETLEVGPQIEAPSEDHLWIPGTWRYHETRYVWRPGYWTVVQPGWVWVPARHVWCPSGYVFVDGYWDYPLEERGLLFAPVYYHEPVYQQANYYYTPTVVISTEILRVHLFSRPRYCHYYFGDYYAPRYREIGIEPWLMFPRIRGSYDPLFQYYGWHHRRYGRGDWYGSLRDRYQFFARHEHYRPAHTYAALRRQRFDGVRTGDINIQNNIQNILVQQNNLAVNFNQYVQNVEQDVRIDGDRGDRLERRGRMQFARIGTDERRDYLERARDIRSFQERRSELERQARISDRGDRERGDRGQFDRGGRGGRRSLRLADFEDRREGREVGEAGERADRRARRGRDRAGVAANAPPTPDQTAGGTTEGTTGAPDSTAGADRGDRRGRSFERPGRLDVTQDPTGDEQSDRDAIGRRGRERDGGIGLGRAGRDGPQLRGAQDPAADRDVTTQVPSDAATTPGGTAVTDPTDGRRGAMDERLDALRRARGASGERTRGFGDLDATESRGNTSGIPGTRPRGRGAFDTDRRIGPNDRGADLSGQQRAENDRRRQTLLRERLGLDDAQPAQQPGARRGQFSERGRSDLRSRQNQPGETRPDAAAPGFPRGLGDSDASDLRNRQLRARGNENRSQADRDAFRTRGQSSEDTSQRSLQSQRQDALRRQLEQRRGVDQGNRSRNLEQLLNQQRGEARRERGSAADIQPRTQQQFGRGRTDLESLRGRGSARSAFGDAAQRDSDARRRAFGSSPRQESPGQENARQSLNFGQRGGQTPGLDARSRIERSLEGRRDSNARGQSRPEARSSFGERGGRAEALQRMSRGRSGADASQQMNRGAGRRSLSRQQEQSPPTVSGAERGGRSGGEERRGERGGGRGGERRDRDDDD